MKYQHTVVKYQHTAVKYQLTVMKYQHTVVKYQHTVVKYQHTVLLFFSGSSIFKIDVPEKQCSSCQTFRSGGHYRVHTQRPSVEAIHGTSQSLLINVAVALQIMPRRLPYASFPIYCLLFILSMF